MKRILIVEDDVDLGQTVAQSLAEEGYATEIASDGQAALDALRREVPDLVLLGSHDGEHERMGVPRAAARRAALGADSSGRADGGIRVGFRDD